MHLVALTPEEYLGESLSHDGTNYQPGSWGSEPGQEYYYSVSAYPLLRYMIGEVSGLSYPEYMQVNIFEPLGMIHSSFNAAESPELHTIPYTRVEGGNSELPVWDGQGWMMHTTAEDMAAFTLALMNSGLYDGYQILGLHSIELMQEITSSFRVFFKSSDDLPTSGYGLGLFSFQGGWYGFGGSAPGYQSLLRYHPTRQVGYVIITNVNGILSSEYGSARSEIYTVQDALVSILDPTLALRYLADEMLLFAAAGLVWSFIMRTRANILAATGMVWIVAGGAWAFKGTAAGLGLVSTGIVSLVWGGISLLKARRVSTGPDALDGPSADR
jgi:CubicO group peptidase (beta-lactamase class C family)